MRAAPALAVVLAVAVAAGEATSDTGRTLSVAYVTDLAAQPNPHDLRGSALLGFERAVRTFRVRARVVQFDPREGAGPTLAFLARQHFDLVVVGEVRSYLDVDALVAVAGQFPQTKFVFADPPFLRRWPPNVQGAIWHVEEPAYLAGYLAGLVEQWRAVKDVVGSVGGFPIVSVDTFIAGFEAGARDADPGITILRSYSYDFINPAPCRSAAVGQITRGAGVLFNVAGACGLATLRAARAKGVWGIGVDVDQSFLGPNILTSVLKRFDVQVYDTVRALVRGRLRTGGNAVWTLENGAVGLGKISPRVPASFRRELERVRRQIEAGRIVVPTKPAKT